MGISTSKIETPIGRVTRSKKESKASYDRLSRWYDALTCFSEKKFRDISLDKLGVQEGEKVLEIGFGTGYGVLALARSVGSMGKVYGIDISEGMSNIARAKVWKAGLSERVDLKCGDGSFLPFKANFFDAIFMSFTLELFDTPEIPIVLHQCQRVLRNGGRICVVALSKKEKAGWLMRLYEWAHRRFPSFIDCRPILVQNALGDSGFQLVDVAEMSMWGLPVEIVVGRKMRLE